jgi:hypothetical protein
MQRFLKIFEEFFAIDKFLLFEFIKKLTPATKLRVKARQKSKFERSRLVTRIFASLRSVILDKIL